MSDLEDGWLADWLDASAEAEAELAGYKDRLEAAWGTGQMSWPKVELSLELFVRYLVSVLPEVPTEPLCWEDLFICAACAHGTSNAHEAFLARFSGDMKQGVALVRMPADHQEDALQQVSLRLLVKDGDREARLRSYRGKGPLGKWVQVAATRVALNVLRREKRYRRQDDEELILALSDSVDPELADLQEMYRPIVRRAVESAFGALIPSDRDILRRYVVQRLTLSELAGHLAVSVTTAHRRLRTVRERLHALIRDFLSNDEGMSPSECASVIRLAESGFHLSVGRLLADDPSRVVEEPG